MTPSHGLSGRFAPIPTPFADDGSAISEPRLAKLVRWLHVQGVDGLVVCSEIGERSLLSAGERKSVAEVVLREANPRHVIVTATANSTAVALDLSQHAARHGARAVVLEPPAVEDLTDDELANHFEIVVKYADIPVIAIDPHKLLSRELRDSICRLPSLSAGLPLTEGPDSLLEVERGLERSDEFASGGVCVSPLLLFSEIIRDRRSLAVAMRRFGRVQVAKAVYGLHDIEVGPPRLPLLAARGAALDAVRNLV